MGSICSPEEAKEDSNTEPSNPKAGRRKGGAQDSVDSQSAAPDADGPGGMKIVVTPAANGDDLVPSDIESPSASDTEPEKPKPKIDSTLGGKISWKKVADFSALLPRDVKLKLWKGVFKQQSDYDAPEEYKKTNEAVPNDLKTQLPGAVKEPSKFISAFLKREDKNGTMNGIFEALKQRFNTDDESKKAKYAKKLEVTEKNYNELMMDPLKDEFNEDDFLKTAFLQYMLYAYQQDMDQ